VEGTAIRARQAELDRYAQKMGWERGPFRSWTTRGYTIALAARGYPKRQFVITHRDSAERRHVDDLEDVIRFLDYVRVTGREPGR
jgi:hypothetical protein